MLYILIITAVFLLEQKIKNHMEQNRQLGKKDEILKGRIVLKKQYNRGMFLNLLEDSAEAVKLLSGILLGFLLVVFAILMPMKRKKLMKLGLALCIGGAVSNIWDRYKRGHVVDYFSFNLKPLRSVVFNLADMFIMVGSFLILLSSLFFPKTKNRTDEAA